MVISISNEQNLVTFKEAMLLLLRGQFRIPNTGTFLSKKKNFPLTSQKEFKEQIAQVKDHLPSGILCLL